MKAFYDDAPTRLLALYDVAVLLAVMVYVIEGAAWPTTP